MSETQSAPTVQPTDAKNNLAKLYDALSKAQGDFPVIPKDSEVEVRNKEGKFLYKYKYADLTTIINHTRPALSKYGLSFTQGMTVGGFHTLIQHADGGVISTGYIPCEIPKNADMKNVAGTITYVKRISLTAALGVSADEDVDAAPVEGSNGKSTEKKSSQVSAPKSEPTKNQPKDAPAKPKNYAPGADLPQDQQPDYDNQVMTLADEYALVIEQKGLTPKEVGNVIKATLGGPKSPSKMTEAELIKVIKMLSLSKPG